MQAVQQIDHEKLHRRALEISGEYLRFEARLIGVLQELDRAKTYLHYEQPSLFAYVTRCLKLSEHVALSLIGIARKSVQVPELKAAIEERRINVSNARRIVPILTTENKAHWIEKAERCSQGKLDQELARAFPERTTPTKVKYKGEALARLEVDLSHGVLELLKRTQEILSQQNKKYAEVSHVLGVVLEEYVERHDPTRKAERAAARAAKNRAGHLKSASPALENLHILKRVHLDTRLKHQVVLRDQNQCTHRDPEGLRCPVRHWLDIHHIRPVSLGGTNDPENLRTLCSGHHRMSHFFRS